MLYSTKRVRHIYFFNSKLRLCNKTWYKKWRANNQSKPKSDFPFIFKLYRHMIGVVLGSSLEACHLLESSITKTLNMYKSVCYCWAWPLIWMHGIQTFKKTVRQWQQKMAWNNTCIFLPHKVYVRLRVDGTYHTALSYIMCPTKFDVNIQSSASG